MLHRSIPSGISNRNEINPRPPATPPTRGCRRPRRGTTTPGRCPPATGATRRLPGPSRWRPAGRRSTGPAWPGPRPGRRPARPYTLNSPSVPSLSEIVLCTTQRRVAHQIQRLHRTPHHAEGQPPFEDERFDGADARRPVAPQGADQAQPGRIEPGQPLGGQLGPGGRELGPRRHAVNIRDTRVGWSGAAARARRSRDGPPSSSPPAAAPPGYWCWWLRCSWWRRSSSIRPTGSRGFRRPRSRPWWAGWPTGSR